MKIRITLPGAKIIYKNVIKENIKSFVIGVYKPLVYIGHNLQIITYKGYPVMYLCHVCPKANTFLKLRLVTYTELPLLTTAINYSFNY